MTDTEWVDIDDVHCLRETDMALLISFDGEEKWIPKSVVSETSEVLEKGDSGTLLIAEWFATREGLD